uniref:Uncharacterized protein n=1 Tax=Oryza nivara TaxID=4536 RepID=A0A0E0H7Y0_ORYNI
MVYVKWLLYLTAFDSLSPFHIGNRYWVDPLTFIPTSIDLIRAKSNACAAPAKSADSMEAREIDAGIPALCGEENAGDGTDQTSGR